jgi:hypothetical protein
LPASPSGKTGVNNGREAVRGHQSLSEVNGRSKRRKRCRNRSGFPQSRWFNGNALRRALCPRPPTFRPWRLKFG